MGFARILTPTFAIETTSSYDKRQQHLGKSTMRLSKKQKHLKIIRGQQNQQTRIIHKQKHIISLVNNYCLLGLIILTKKFFLYALSIFLARFIIRN